MLFGVSVKIICCTEEIILGLWGFFSLKTMCFLAFQTKSMIVLCLISVHLETEKNIQWNISADDLLMCLSFQHVLIFLPNTASVPLPFVHLHVSFNLMWQDVCLFAWTNNSVRRESMFSLSVYAEERKEVFLFHILYTRNNKIKKYAIKHTAEISVRIFCLCVSLLMWTPMKFWVFYSTDENECR